jgi:Flp pilus assembly pilin Flp
MRTRVTMIQKFLRDQRGAILAEYALLATLIAVVCAAAVFGIGKSVSEFFSGGIFP